MSRPTLSAGGGSPRGPLAALGSVADPLASSLRSRGRRALRASAHRVGVLVTNFRTAALTLDRPGDPSVFGDDVRAAAAELIARKPTGEYLVSVCTNTLCGMLGGDEIYAALSQTLGVGMNETTPDGAITLEHAECLAACDYAPVVTVNYEFFDNQTVESAGDLVARLQAGERPLPTRGAPLCTFKEIERQIAGFLDERPESLDAEATGAPTEVGVKLAIERKESAPSYSIGRE